MSENGIAEAEQRVREMNRMAQQYSEQGNRYLQSMRNAQNVRQTRFEPAGSYSQQKNGQDNFSGNRMMNQPQQNRQQNQDRQRQQPVQNYPHQPQQDQHNHQNFRNQQNNASIHHGNSGRGQGNPYSGGEDHVYNEIHSEPVKFERSSGFPDLLADNEKLMILLLIYLLMKEKADIKLILALGYLLL